MARLTLAGARIRPDLQLGLILLAPALLALSRLAPDDGAWLALRLTTATACVLLVPGALVVRAIGWRGDAGVAVAAALAWSLGLGFLGLAITFAAAASLSLMLVVVGAAAGAALVPALLRRAPALPRAHVLCLAGLTLAGLALGAAVWWHSESVGGDGLFHLGRVRKLDELSSLPGLASMNEFADGGLHPGYAFPLWHAELALVARLADADAGQTVLYVSAALVPLALLLAYATGTSLFGSWGAGLAVAAMHAGVFAFARAGVGSFAFLSLPATASIVLLVPAVLALCFAYVRQPRRRDLAAIALAGLALVAVHPTYALFVCLPLAGFAVARVILGWRDGIPDTLRTLVALVCVGLPTAAFVAWLAPTVDDAVSFRLDDEQRQRDFAQYATQLVGSPDAFHVDPAAIARGGAVVVLGLALLPLVAFARRSRFAAFALGGTLAILLVLLVTPLFTELSQLVSLSQSRRLIRFLPVAIALAGVAVVLGRWRLPGAALALAAGVAATLLYPAEVGYRVEEGGPAWAPWVGLAGGAAVLAGARLIPGQISRASSRWTALTGVLLVLPLAVDGLAELRKEPTDRHALSRGLTDAVRSTIPQRDVVFADLETSYRLAAAAPVLIAAAPPSHVASTARNRPLQRRQDVIRVLLSDGVTNDERTAILERYGARWLVAERGQLAKRPELADLGTQVYGDSTFVLLRLESGT